MVNRSSWWPFGRADLDPDDMEVVGAAPTPLRDLYHLMLRAPWWLDLLGLSVSVLLINLIFAVGFYLSGGVEGANPDSLRDLFFFSVQTMGTIGYGAMYPRSAAAETLVTLESLVGMFTVALITGLIFAKFSRTRARIVFAEHAAISPFDGTPTLMFRLGNERDTPIVDTVVRVVMFRTEHTLEGTTIYRMYDLPLVRERAPGLTRSWTVMHVIDDKSKLQGATPESLARDEIEFMVTVIGVDEVSGQLLNGRHRYDAREVRWGYRHADLLSEREDGGLRLDIRLFHNTVPTRPTDDFPYPAVLPDKPPVETA